ncbi:TNFAIP3-interacting protein 1-like isoform X2 [Betta splendens]|nr:TNFAIP3-interacting protein 1-like isoform X2 [Betta splendens]
MMDRSQTSENVPTDDFKPPRLYPSLPCIDRYDVYQPRKLQASLGSQPEGPQEDAQSDGGHIKMRARMLILEEQRQELLSINERWAKEYRTMVQYYKQKVRDLKALLHQSHGSPGDELRKVERLTLNFNDKLQFNAAKETKWAEDADAELLKAREEARALRAQNSSLTRRGQHQQEEIQRLNKALKEALLTAQPLGCSETLQDLWKHQAEVYKEDFLKERKDREKLKGKYLELKSRFIKVHNELCVFKPQATPQQPRAQRQRHHPGGEQ